MPDLHKSLDADQQLLLSIIQKHHPDGRFTLFGDMQPIQGDEEGFVLQMPKWISEASDEFEKRYGNNGQKRLDHALKMFFREDEDEKGGFSPCCIN